MVNQISNRIKVVGFYFSNNNDRFFTLVSINAEGNHIARAYAFNFTNSSLNIFGEDISTTDNNHIFNSSTNNQFSIKQVRQVAGAQPAFVKHVACCVGSLVVTRSHAGAA